MVIWILDCATQYCTKFVLSEEKEKELEDVFDGDVEWFLDKYHLEFGGCVSNCLWMVADKDLFDEVNF